MRAVDSRSRRYDPATTPERMLAASPPFSTTGFAATGTADIALARREPGVMIARRVAFCVEHRASATLAGEHGADGSPRKMMDPEAGPSDHASREVTIAVARRMATALADKDIVDIAVADPPTDAVDGDTTGAVLGTTDLSRRDAAVAATLRFSRAASEGSPRAASGYPPRAVSEYSPLAGGPAA